MLIRVNTYKMLRKEQPRTDCKRDTLLATQANVLQDLFNLTTPTRKSQIAFLSFCKIEATLAQLYRNVERRMRRIRGRSERIAIWFIRCSHLY